MIIGLPFTAFWALIGSGYSEGYFPLFPYIDTQFSDGYSFQNWNRVHIGMTTEDVRQILGLPLNSGPALDWIYTRDGKCVWGDFAWEYRYINFSEAGVVTGKVVRWFYD